MTSHKYCQHLMAVKTFLFMGHQNKPHNCSDVNSTQLKLKQRNQLTEKQPERKTCTIHSTSFNIYRILWEGMRPRQSQANSVVSLALLAGRHGQWEPSQGCCHIAPAHCSVWCTSHMSQVVYSFQILAESCSEARHGYTDSEIPHCCQAAQRETA